MKVVGIIPARYNSSRFKGKALVDICGKPMIQHVYEQAKKSRLLNNLIVATDDRRIYNAVINFGGKAVLTKIHSSGTDRIAEAAGKIKADIIVNIQGDEPLISSRMIDSAVSRFKKDKKAVMGTMKKEIASIKEALNPNIVKVITDKDNNAIYFSRLPIPFLRDENKRKVSVKTYYKHIGLYLYTRAFLLKFSRMKQTLLEKKEKLEQLRALENGYKIKVYETDYDTIGVDTPDDLKQVKKMICKGRKK